MSNIETISKLKKSLKSPKRKNTNATFNKKKMSKITEEEVLPLPEIPKSPKTPTPPNIEFPKSKSPKSPKMQNEIQGLPGIPSNKSFDARYVAMRPSIERFEENEIIKKNPKVSMQELSEILGVTKIRLPHIKTKLDEINLPSVNVEKAKSPSRVQSKKKSSSCDIMIGGKMIDKSMVSLERSSTKKPVYNVSELKEIGKQLGLSLNGPKDVLVISILKELESRGC